MAALYYENILSAEDLEYLSGLPEVLKAKSEVDGKNVVYFSIVLPENIVEKINTGFGLELSAGFAVPMRWMRGDTRPHVDVGGGANFENTYLMYLTDSPGNLVVGEENYSIGRGKGYVFSEGVRHETVGTGLEPRLLLGPMSEAGVAVGVVPSTIFIRQSGSDVEFSYDQSTWAIISWPFLLNSGATVDFLTDITLTTTSDYFICNGDNIRIGSASLSQIESAPAPPRRPVITVTANSYDGLIVNGDDETLGNNNIYIYNLIVDGTGYTTQVGGGWIGRRGFGNGVTDNYIVNCSVSGNLPPGGDPGTPASGGIVGAYAGKGGTLVIYGCSSSVTMGQLCGGIVGAYAGCNGGSVSCKQCFFTGVIPDFCGGIFGDYAGESGYAEAVKCYTTGVIGENAGGIYGRFAGYNGSANAIECYSRGNIGADGGGIFGLGAGAGAGLSPATNCYSSGTIATSGNGIYGSGAVDDNPIHCYAAGGSWSDSLAEGLLQGVPLGSNKVGTVWVATDGINQPYELNGIGYTPYSVNIINGLSELVQTFNQTVQAGQSSIGAIYQDTSGNNFEILQQEGGDPGSYGSINMNSNTGIITVASSVVPGVYTLTVRSIGSYNITTFELTVTGGGGGGTEVPVEELSCCAKPMDLYNISYELRNRIIAGNTIIGSTSIRRTPISYSDLYNKKMAYASKR